MRFGRATDRYRSDRSDILALRHSAFCDPSGFRFLRRPCWLGPFLESVVSGERIHPLFARRRRRHTDLRLRLDVVARDRLAAPKQSAGSGTTGGPVTTGPAGSPVTPSHRVCGRPRLANDRAPLLRFPYPLQRSPAAMRCPRAASPLLGDDPASTLAGPRPTRACSADRFGRRSSLRFYAGRIGCGVARSGGRSG